MGVSQARASQIENAVISEVATLVGHVRDLGGQRKIEPSSGESGSLARV